MHTINKDWWPNQLNLKPLARHARAADPMGDGFDYAEEFKSLDLEALRRDLFELMTTSQDWWPADYGHYGPLFIRMAWHSAGTYRISDGRGGGGAGTQRYAPLNSWPDNANLDKARRLLWPVKQQVRPQDLVGRPDDPRRQLRPRVDGIQDAWDSAAAARTCGSPRTSTGGPRTPGSETSATAATRELDEPFGAVQMGLIYVNPEGPNGNPDPVAAAQGHPRDLPPHGDERRGDRRADRRRAHLRQGPRCGRRGPVRRSRTRGGRPGGAGSRLEDEPTAPARAPIPSPAGSRARGRPIP